MSKEITQITNWEESINLEVGKYFRPHTLDEIKEIVLNKENPSPVRASGSRHSTTRCGVSDNGTLVDMRNFDQVLEITDDTITVEAGCLLIDAAKILEQEGKQFHVNVEIGNITIGSAATCGTKDASFEGEFGQLGSYLVEAKIINAKGEIEIFDENHPQMQSLRSSYGLFGIVYEATFKIKDIQCLRVFHKTYTIDEFAKIHHELIQSKESIMYYLFPFRDKITIEFRSYSNKKPNKSVSRRKWKMRNLFWKKIAPAYGYYVTKYIPFPGLQTFLYNSFNSLLRFLLCNVIVSNCTIATDQMIRYPEKKNRSKYTFSIWAFPEKVFPEILRDYFEFCKKHYKNTGYKTDVLNVGYRIAKDQNPMFSYSYNGNVMTADPVATGEKGWDEFLQAYNEFCIQRKGIPMFNQSKWLNRDLVHKAFGLKVKDFWKIRKEMDPEERFLNNYFRELFSPDL
ncbi:FAD-binding protein [Aureivirga sp. CE67]|uniref:FAD-binding protein n=1 Tax=Aureivirga sp. CE67 TaxID=1788983 RepID=UPI0018C9665A|nr:FAD-binding protein [Aureivirga sp. CE67]